MILRPGECALNVMTDRVGMIVIVVVITVVAIVSCITALCTAGSNNCVGVNVVQLNKMLGVAIAAVTGVNDIACRSTGSLCAVTYIIAVTGCSNLLSGLVGTVFAGNHGLTVGRTGCVGGYVAQAVTGCRKDIGLPGFSATNTDMKCVTLLGTGRKNGIKKLFLMSVLFTSLLRCKSGYRVVGEVVGLEANVAVSVGCLDCLRFSFLINIPYENTVNVLTVLGSIRNSYGNEITLAEVGNIFIGSYVGNSKVVNRVISKLNKLLLGEKCLCVLKILTVKSAGRNADLLILDSTACACNIAKVKACILQSNLTRIYKILGLKVGVCLGRSVNNGLGFSAAVCLTGECSNVAIENSFVPAVAVVLRNGLVVRITANRTGVKLGSPAYTGSLGNDACLMRVTNRGRTLYVLVANLTLIKVNIGTSILIYKKLVIVSNVLDVVAKRRLGLHLIAVAAVTGINYVSCLSTGCAEDFIGIAMAKRRLACIAVISLTAMSLGTASLLIPIVTESIGLAVGVAIVAYRAGMSSVTADKAGGLGNHAVIVVTYGGYRLGFGFTAMAGVGSYAGSNASGLCGYLTLAPIVSRLFTVFTLTLGTNRLFGTGCRTAVAGACCEFATVGVYTSNGVSSVAVGNSIAHIVTESISIGIGLLSCLIAIIAAEEVGSRLGTGRVACYIFYNCILCSEYVVLKVAVSCFASRTNSSLCTGRLAAEAGDDVGLCTAFTYTSQGVSSIVV